MIRECAWCGRLLGEDRGPRACPISHGVCPDCLQEVLGSRAVPIQDFLDSFGDPVLLVDQDGRILKGNRQALQTLGRGAEEVEGRFGGDAFCCRYAELPGGCGNTVHCRSCTIRRTVEDTLLTGRPHLRVPAYPDLHFEAGEFKVEFLISTERVDGVVLLRIDQMTLGAAEPR